MEAGGTYLWCDQVKPLLYTAFLATFAFRQPRPLRPVQNWSRKTFPLREEAQAARHELNCTFHLLSSHSCYPSWALNPAACVWHCTWSCHSLHSPSLRIFIASGAISKIYYTSVTLESWLVSQVMVLPLHLYFGFLSLHVTVSAQFLFSCPVWEFEIIKHALRKREMEGLWVEQA